MAGRADPAVGFVAPLLTSYRAVFAHRGAFAFSATGLLIEAVTHDWGTPWSCWAFLLLRSGCRFLPV